MNAKLIIDFVFYRYLSYELHAYPKLGWRDQEGGWTHLLGAVAEGEVHVAADTVELSIENIRDDMDVTLPIIRTTLVF